MWILLVPSILALPLDNEVRAMQAQETDLNMCSLNGCTEVDLLPSRCKSCGKVFCSNHILLANHSCKAVVDKVAPTCPLCGQPVPLSPGQTPDRAVSLHIDRGCLGQSHSRQNYCSFRNCTRNEVVLMLCDRCKQSFCVSHRHPAQHDCSARTPPPELLKAPAREVVPTKISEMRMGNSVKDAVGSNTIRDPVIIRVFFDVEFRRLPLYFAFTPTTPLGKILDVICRHADIKNENHLPSATRLTLFSLDSPTPLNPSMNLSESGLRQNSGVILIRGEQLGPHLEAELAPLWKAKK